MCYFDQTRWTCGFWRWGQFRQQCNREYRTGETCGMKLVYHTIHESDRCRLCGDMEKKHGRITKHQENIRRWEREGSRTASIEKATCDIEDIEAQISKLLRQHIDKEHSL